MSPFSHYLHRLRLDRELRQSELAELLGYEQSYISALEVGSKGPPTLEFISKLVEKLRLSATDQQALQDAVAASERKLVLEGDSPQDVYWMLKELRDQVDALHPMQIKMIRQVLCLKDCLAVPELDSLGRGRRRRREGAPM
jgi:transcriptional regulator with XRE-family HTH domain